MTPSNSFATTLRLVFLVLLWTLAGGLMVLGTFSFGHGADPAQRAWFGWGMFVSNLALIPTSWEIVSRTCRRQRVQVETLARIMAQEAARHASEHEKPSGSVAHIY